MINNTILPYPDFWAETVLLLHGDGTNGSTTFTDSTGKNTITANGNAQISTTQSKFGRSSMLFDGTDDYIDTSNSSNFGFGSGDYTIECWVNPSTATLDRTIFDNRTGVAVGIGIYTSSQANPGNLVIANNTVAIAIGGSIPVNTWSHIAVTRASGTIKGFINGVQVCTVTDSRTYSSSSVCRIGVNSGNTGGNPVGQDYIGYIDDLRITKGVARYTSNFTPPTQPFPNF